jgi:flagellar biosynthetic protein FliP
VKRAIPFAALVALPIMSLAAPTGMPAISVATGTDGSQTYTLTIQILLLMTLLTLLPAILLSMTSFTRIIIVLSLLRQAIGLAQTPPNQVLVGLALFMTLFIMGPVLSQSYNLGVRPYLDGRIEAQAAFSQATAPVKEFMLHQTRDGDLAMFAKMSGQDGYASPSDVPLSVLIPTFITSELKTAFQIGFMVFIPFLIIDLVVASVLMSMGMMMLSPMLVSLPFKIMLFVLVDGWSLVMGTLASSFYS